MLRTWKGGPTKRMLTLDNEVHGVASVVSFLVGSSAGVVAGMFSPKMTHNQTQTTQHHACGHIVDHLCSLWQVVEGDNLSKIREGRIYCQDVYDSVAGGRHILENVQCILLSDRKCEVREACMGDSKKTHIVVPVQAKDGRVGFHSAFEEYVVTLSELAAIQVSPELQLHYWHVWK